MEQGQDPVVKSFRERISEEDRRILEAINRRIELVSELHGYKLSRGYPLVDRSREGSLVQELGRLNGGPLSSEGLRQVYEALIEVSKQEAARQAR